MKHTLRLKPTHNAIKTYYNELQQLSLLDAHKEGAVSPAFANLLRHCGKQFDWTLYEQYPLKHGTKNIYPDGALVDAFNLPCGYWEAKDIKDDLEREIGKKFAKGYPKDNILFQTPQQAILYQNGIRKLDSDLTQPDELVAILKDFFHYRPPAYDEWDTAVEAFKEEVPKIGQGILDRLRKERWSNLEFKKAFETFAATCRTAINPNLSEQAVEEMLIQHLMTERLFSRIFDLPDFRDMNIIAVEIEKVVKALVAQHGGRRAFLQPLDRFYKAIEATALQLDDFEKKQGFLNIVYEKFFQGFSVKVADTHGIVYTPQPVVQFMVKSVEEILRQEFDSSLSDEGVHILDPFVGTGNFMISVMRTLKKTALARKYAAELHCNEVMLLPYYIASMNIEHEYMSMTGTYQPFDGICLMDTFQLTEEAEQLSMDSLTEENAERVNRQKKAPIFVILGNPPYNVGQANENDNNKNRKYPVIDGQVRETYAKDSRATNKNALSDVYVKAFRWASNRIGDEGVVAFVTNSGFVDGIAFDGMRKHLAQDFSRLYIFDLKGNVRKDSMRDGIPIGEAHTIFGLGAMVGIAISLLVKNPKHADHKIYYSDVDWNATRKEKFAIIDEAKTYSRLESREITPDTKHTWLTEGLSADFDGFIPLGTKEAKAAKTEDVETIFKNYSRGAETTRDAWAYNFNQIALQANIERFIETYNQEVHRWQSRTDKQIKLDNFVLNDDTKIKWSSRLKECLKRGQYTECSSQNIRKSIYRPFTAQNLYFDSVLTHRQGQFPHILPIPDTESENRVLCVSGVGSSRPFHCAITDIIPCLDMLEKTQCFPFYTYDEDGRHRRENITDWALQQFRAHYQDDGISKWDIFHYVYALLHHPRYREHYAANLKRELPRIPFVGSSRLRSTTDEARLLSEVEAFRAFAGAGKRLADLHVNYEQQSTYKLKYIEKAGEQLDWRVEKMKLSKDKTQIVYNHFLTLSGIPPEAFEYKLGNKSALHWILDQYRVKTDIRSGIVNDPNRADEPEYIVHLIQRIVTVSVETVKIVKNLPALQERH